VPHHPCVSLVAADRAVSRAFSAGAISIHQWAQTVKSWPDLPDQQKQRQERQMKTYFVLNDLSRSFNHSCNPNAGFENKRRTLFVSAKTREEADREAWMENTLADI
jgi:hypothetical protein